MAQLAMNPRALKEMALTMTQWETRNIATKCGRKFYWQILELVKGYRVPF